jgi:hypothetical protein
MQDSAAGPVHDVCQQDDDQDDDHQPEEEHDDSGDDVPSYSSRSSHGLQLPGATRIIRNGRGAATMPIGHEHFQVLFDQTGDQADDRPRARCRSAAASAVSRRSGLAGRTARTRRLRGSGTGDNRSWATCLRIPRRIDRESGWRCPVAGSGRSSLFRAPVASPSCWRMAPGWPACGPPAGVAGLAWVRAGPAEARSA